MGSQIWQGGWENHPGLWMLFLFGDGDLLHSILGLSDTWVIWDKKSLREKKKFKNSKATLFFPSL